MTAEIARAVDAINVNINVAGMNAINIILSFVMFGVALGIKPSIFVEVFKKPKSVIIGTTCQLILLPLFTCLLAIALGDFISPMMGLGMILVAACPGGNISNFISSLSKGNIELSVSLTAISTALAVVLTPASFWLWGTLYLKFAHFAADVPTLIIPLFEVFKTIFILLGIPLVLGMLCSTYLPKVANALKKPLQILSIIFFLGIVVLSFSNNFDAFMQSIKYIFIVVMLHNLLALSIGYFTSTACKLSWKDRKTLTIESGIQNSGLGLVLLFNPAIFGNFPPHGGMLVITAWWGIWHIISGLTVAGIFNSIDKRRQL